MIRYRFVLAVVLWMSSRTSLGAGIETVEGPPSPRTVGERIEWRVRLDRSYADPFDPAVVAVEAEVTGPEGFSRRFTGFWSQDFTSRLDEGGVEVLEAVSEPSFRVRFRPVVSGSYTVVIRVTDAEGQAESDVIGFEVGPATPGFLGYVRRDQANPYALVRSTGQPYLPYGFNVCWSGPGGTTEFERWFQKLADHGLNWSRVWMTHFNGTALEWKSGGDGGAYCGLGCYNLKAAWRLDQILALAEARGIALQLVLQQHSQFETKMWSSWAENPWNQANGGPLERSADFFTRPDVIALFDRKVRYLVARWADSPALLAWELFNEVDLIDGADPDAVRLWMRGRANLIRALDPYDHLVTTSYAMPDMGALGQDWAFEGYDLIQVHSYFPFYWSVIESTGSYLRTFGKPVLLAEFGVDFLGRENLEDSVGAHLHNATVLAGLRGFTGGAMSWWWDGYVDILDLWGVVGRAGAGLRWGDISSWRALLDGVTTTAGPAIEARAASMGYGALVWLHDPGSDWKTASAAEPPLHSGLEVHLPIACEGGIARFFSTWTAAELGSVPVKAEGDGTSTFAVPDFTRDLLARVDCPPPSFPDPATPEPKPSETAGNPSDTGDEGAGVAEASGEAVPSPLPKARAGGCSARF